MISDPPPYMRALALGLLDEVTKELELVVYREGQELGISIRPISDLKRLWYARVPATGYNSPLFRLPELCRIILGWYWPEFRLP